MMSYSFHVSILIAVVVANWLSILQCFATNSQSLILAVDNLHDDYPPSPEYCITSSDISQNYHCNIRSAWSACLSDVARNGSCTILLPESVRIPINSSMGELDAIATTANIQIIGQGSTIFYDIDEYGSGPNSDDLVFVETIPPPSAQNTNYNTTTSNTTDRSFWICPEDSMTFIGKNVDSSNNGDTTIVSDPLIRLHRESDMVEVAYSDDYYGLMPVIRYQAPASSEGNICQNYSLHIGCYGGGNCDVQVDVYRGFARGNRFIFFQGSSAKSSLALSNLTIEFFGKNSSINGGAIYVEGDVDFQLLDINFDNNIGNFGGSLFMNMLNDNNANSSNSIVLQRLAFQDNSAESGGSIYLDKQCENIFLSDINVGRSVATNDGGAISLNLDNNNIIFSHIVLDHPYSEEGNGGGVFFNSGNTNITMIEVSLVHPSAHRYGGGIAMMSNNIDVAISNLSIIHAQSAGGGGMYIGNNNQYLVLTNSMMVNCEADARSYPNIGGGGIAVDSHNYVVIVENMTFVNSSSSDYGGTIELRFNNSFFTITNSVFNYSTGLYSGGAIYMSYANMWFSISSSIFLNCQAQGYFYGGSIGLDEFNNYGVISNCSFSVNYDAGIEVLNAEEGGAIFMYDGNEHVTISNCMFMNLRSNDDGGAIVLYQKNHFISIMGNLFYNCSAKTAGGAIYLQVQNNYTSIVNNQFEDCFVLQEFGGALMASDTNSNLYFAHNQVLRCHSVGKETYFGGGSVAIGYTHDGVVVENSTFLGPSDAGSTLAFGGCLGINYFNPSFVVRSSTFTNCSANSAGGAIYVQYVNDVTIESSTFSGCQAPVGGAIAFWMGNDDFILTNNQFQNNTASLAGGALYFYDENSHGQIVYNLFEDNKASLGGAIALNTSNTKITIGASTFQANTATLHGGAVYSYESNDYFTIIDSLGYNYTADEAIWSSYFPKAYIFKKNVSIPQASQYIFGFYQIKLSEFTYLDVYVDNKLVLSYNDESTSFPGIDQQSMLYDAKSVTVVFRVSDSSDQTCDDAACGVWFFINPVVDSEKIVLNNDDDDGTISYSDDPTNHVFNVNGVTQNRRNRVIQNDVSMTGAGLETVHLLQKRQQRLFDYISTTSNSTDVIETKSTIFKNNIANKKAGAVFFHNNNQYVNIIHAKFSENHSKTSGGAIFSQLVQSAVILINSYFEWNHAETSGGAVVFLAGCFAHIIMGNQFYNNDASQNGGALYIGTSNGDGSFATQNQIILSKNRFESNYAGADGGGMYIDGENIMQVIDNVFSYSAADMGNGGAVYLNSLNTIEFSDTVFANGYAHGCGGGLTSNSGNTIIFSEKPSNFSANEALDVGGSLCLKSASKMLIVDTLVTVEYSTAYFGGAIAIMSSYLWEVRGSNASLLISTNIASRGSALFCYPLLQSPVRLENVTFAYNRAIGGGTVYWVYEVKKMTIEPPGLYDPTVNFIDNQAPYGLIVGTQALQVVTPTNYEVTVYGSSINPPISVYLKDYYNQFMRISNDTTVYMTIVNAHKGGHLIPPNCMGLNPSIAGSDVSGVMIFKGYATFANTQLYCSPIGNFTLQFEARLGSDTGVPSQLAAPFYLQNTTFVSFRACSSGEYEKNGQCTTCPSGSYSLSSDVTEESCQDCTKTEGVNTCYGNQIILSSGYWRRYDSTTAVLSCPFGSSSCVGGNITGQALCAEGYTGPLCSVCSDGYYLSDGSSCQSCEGKHAISTTLIVVCCVVFIILILFLAYFYFMDLKATTITAATAANTAVSTNATSIISSIPLIQPPTRIELAILWFKSRYGEITVKMKILISTYQIISAVGSVFSIEMPKEFRAFTSFFTIFNLNLTNLFPLACNNNGKGFNFMDKLLWTTLAPIFATIFLFLLFACEYLYLRQQIQSDTNRQRGAKAKQFEITKNKYLNYFFYLTYFILPSVTTTIFQLFVCQTINPYHEDNYGNDDYYLVADMSISCQSSYYKNWILYGVLMIFVYPVGIPLMYFILLYYNRQEILSRSANNSTKAVESGVSVNDPSSADVSKNTVVEKSDEIAEDTVNPMITEQKTNSSGSLTNVAAVTTVAAVSITVVNPPVMSEQASRLSFLWKAYEPQFWYWELIETGRRIMLTAVLSVISPGSSEQNLFSILLALLFIKLYSSCRPYLQDRNDILSEIGQVQVLMTFLCALTVNNGLLSSTWSTMMDTLLVMINLSVMIFLTYDMVLDYRASRSSTKKQTSKDEKQESNCATDADPHKDASIPNLQKKDLFEDEAERDYQEALARFDAEKVAIPAKTVVSPSKNAPANYDIELATFSKSTFEESK